jgi:uncharacterized membrane protein YagU involved in acid resistance
MTQFQTAVSKIGESSNGKDKKQKKEEGENATVKTAEAISENIFDHELEKTEQPTAGNAVHYAFGTTVGAIYGAAAEVAPVTSFGYGLPFGTALFIGADEIAVPALGLSEPPTEIPLSKHAYGLSSHLVYGLTADIVRRAVRKYI